MEHNNTLYRIDTKTGRQLLIFCLLVLPFVLFSLSAFTFIPNTAHISKTAIGTTLARSTQTNDMQARNASGASCSDVITLKEFSVFSGAKIFVNVCALEHLNAFVTSFGAGVIALILLLGCEECGPLTTWIGTIMSGVTGGIDFLQIDVQNCGGAFLEISLNRGIKIEPACDNQT